MTREQKQLGLHAVAPKEAGFTTANDLVFAECLDGLPSLHSDKRSSAEVLASGAWDGCPPTAFSHEAACWGGAWPTQSLEDAHWSGPMYAPLPTTGAVGNANELDPEWSCVDFKVGEPASLPLCGLLNETLLVRAAWSQGSAGHSSGDCRPCAHFWRETGCSRGERCDRCHLCPPTALREYRNGLKVNKQASRRPTDRGEAKPHGENIEFNEPESLRTAVHAVVWYGENIERAVPETPRLVDKSAEWNDGTIEQSDAGRWSLGSSDHMSGKCRPCAHFWRVTGCSVGELCTRCHLCPPSAFREYRQGLKMNRKARRSMAKYGDESVPVISL
eukprot:TRINITY_DN17168_c0_g1_i1.p1 TRINITY_DN17168_c0_g1~~TRINITY_DN17168_c0_g1_i1.p1  ORF type:complete len:361 (-),score=35.93 TRINITY_DN17168_c0_g1_i1:250-1242(-)